MAGQYELKADYRVDVERSIEAQRLIRRDAPDRDEDPSRVGNGLYWGLIWLALVAATLLMGSVSGALALGSTWLAFAYLFSSMRRGSELGNRFWIVELADSGESAYRRLNGAEPVGTTQMRACEEAIENLGWAFTGGGPGFLVAHSGTQVFTIIVDGTEIWFNSRPRLQTHKGRLLRATFSMAQAKHHFTEFCEALGDVEVLQTPFDARALQTQEITDPA